MPEKPDIAELMKAVTSQLKWCCALLMGVGAGLGICAQESDKALPRPSLVWAGIANVFPFSKLRRKWRHSIPATDWAGRHLDRYQLGKAIGYGGMATVYKARHEHLQRPVAIKILTPPRGKKSALAQFEREVQMTSRLSHPNTIQIYDFGRTPEGTFYYVMEYIEGITLRNLVLEGGPQSERRVLHLLKQICHSLQEAHEARLVHQDIKPANIMIMARDGHFDFVKVLDFGLVKTVNHHRRRPLFRRPSKPVTGTPHYMAPERIRHSHQVDARSDVYSLGALTYFLVTGREVFTGETENDICRQHLEAPPVAPSPRLGRPVNPELEAIILTCLEKDRTHRPQSIRELLDRLDAVQSLSPWTQADAVTWWQSRRQQQGKKTAPPLAEAKSTVLLPRL
jgi:serine/threonine protein kinase